MRYENEYVAEGDLYDTSFIDERDEADYIDDDDLEDNYLSWDIEDDLWDEEEYD